MKNNKTEKFKALVSEEKSGWLAKSKWREENQDWLDISFAIAVKIMSSLSANKKNDVFPRSQRELALAMRCSPQYINKLLKGSEKLNLETISKIQNTLKFSIIHTSLTPQKTIIVAQNEITVSLREKVTPKKYKNLNGVIKYNFLTNISLSSKNVYTA
jgi:transcriptional regulator with XRE-family HTH domain